MQAVRRLYVYFIAAVSLGMLAAGLINLLRIAFTQIGASRASGWIIVTGPDALRQQLSLWAAVVIVALPVWLLHWWLAERVEHRPGPEGEDERRSVVRIFYLTLVLAVAFLIWLFQGQSLLSRLLAMGFSEAVRIRESIAAPLAATIIAGLVWGYHAQVARRDAAGGERTGAAVWLPRLYRYGAALAGALLLLFGASDLIRLMVELLFRPAGLVGDTQWWVWPLARGVARLLIGALVWLIHWSVSLQLLRRTDWRGLSEQRSALRRAYLYLLILAGVVGTVVGLTLSLEALLRWLFGVSEVSGDPLAQRLIEPIVAVLPFTAAWAYHRRMVLDEARQLAEGPLQASIRRIYTYGVAFVGLAFASVGMAYLLGLVLDRLLGGQRTLSAPPDWFPRQLAVFLSLLVVGAGVWLWHWYVASRRVDADPASERNATIRRIYLYATLAGSLIAALVSLAVVLYRVLSVLLGVASATGLVSDVSAAVGVVVIASALLAYHGLVLRADLREQREAAEAANRLPLVLIGPPGADLSDTLDTLRTHLPEGYSLQPGEPKN